MSSHEKRLKKLWVMCERDDWKARALKAEAERDKYRKQLVDLMSESVGVVGLHLNGDVAEWDWLIENEWLSAWDECEEAKKESED